MPRRNWASAFAPCGINFESIGKPIAGPLYDRALSQAWAESIRVYIADGQMRVMRGHWKFLPHSVVMDIDNGITIATVLVGEQPEEEPHDDF